MSNPQRLATVRVHFRQWLMEHCEVFAKSEADGQPLQITESMVIRDEHYCGRCFNTPTHRGLWFIEEDELKIVNDRGVVAVFQGDEITAVDAQRDVISLEANRPAEKEAGSSVSGHSDPEDNDSVDSDSGNIDSGNIDSGNIDSGNIGQDVRRAA